MVYLVFFNGYNIEKKFSKEYLNHIYYDQIAHDFQRKNILTPELKTNIDWEQSTRKQLHVLNKDVYKILLLCDGRYYWPNGIRFLCRPYKTRRQGYQEHRRLSNHSDQRKQYIDKTENRNNNKDRQKRRRLPSPSSCDTVRYQTPIQDDWSEELEIYARTNDCYEENQLEDGEILEKSSSSMGSLDRHLSNLNVIFK